MGSQVDWAAAIEAVLANRPEGASVCPSDVARAAGGVNWRAAMEEVRRAARVLVRSGEVQVTQRGRTLDAEGPWRGPIRISRR